MDLIFNELSFICPCFYTALAEEKYGFALRSCRRIRLAAFIRNIFSKRRILEVKVSFKRQFSAAFWLSKAEREKTWRKKQSKKLNIKITYRMAQSLEDRNTATVVLETAMFSLVMLLSLFGNVLVCLAVYRNPRLRCPSNYYIISLAFSDIFQSLCTMPLSIGMLMTGDWPFGTSACYFAAICKFALVKISVYTMVLMAVNRYYKIVKPAKYQTTYKKKFIIVTASLVWIIGILYALVSAFVLSFDAKTHPGFALCAIQFRNHHLVVPIVISVMYLPYFLIIFCYWKIYRVVKIHNGNVSWQNSNVQDVKVSKTLFVTVIGFVSLFLPANCVYLASLVNSSLPRQLSFFSTFLIFSSSCVNPFIYGFMNRAFKNEFKKFLKLKRAHTVNSESS